MDVRRYWSVEDCCWVDCPESEAEAEVRVPEQRVTEPSDEPVRA